MTTIATSVGLSIADDELRAHLPQPILPSRPELERLYWRAWEIGARQTRHGNAQNGFSKTYVDAAFGGNIFQWDTCFLSFFARYSHGLLPIEPALDNFYNKQEPDGYICREYRWENGAALWPKGSGDAINPPLFAWAEWSIYQHTANRERLERVLPHLVRYYDWLAANHRSYQGLYWISAMGCGMDNTPRYAAAWADISMQQALAARCIAAMAEKLGDSALVERFRNEHQTLSALINRYLWDEATGFYWDVDNAGMPMPVKTVAPFWAYLADVANPQQAQQLAAHLRDEKSFWRRHPWPTLAADNPLFEPKGGYWLGAVWAPTNYAIVDGLARYGMYDLAREATLRHLASMVQVMEQTGTIWENYRPDEDAQGIPARPDFVGWTGLGPIAMLIEQVIGVEVNAPERRVTWRVVEQGPHGLRNLRVADATIHLEIDAQGHISASADQPLTLVVQRDSKTEEIAVGA
ncbi:MAG: hypothetical protein MUD01_07540 [Chloroflexaceae bacterium]|nr:hypothetical protein [Chloroflexaceae bacterium]